LRKYLIGHAVKNRAKDFNRAPAGFVLAHPPRKLIRLIATLCRVSNTVEATRHAPSESGQYFAGISKSLYSHTLHNFLLLRFLKLIIVVNENLAPASAALNFLVLLFVGAMQ